MKLPGKDGLSFCVIRPSTFYSLNTSLGRVSLKLYLQRRAVMCPDKFHLTTYLLDTYTTSDNLIDEVERLQGNGIFAGLGACRVFASSPARILPGTPSLIFSTSGHFLDVFFVSHQLVLNLPSVVLRQDLPSGGLLLRVHKSGVLRTQTLVH